MNRKIILLLTILLVMGMFASCAQSSNNMADNSNVATDTADSNSATKTSDETTDTDEFDRDVIVVGAGGAGLTAAIAAHDSGADVVVLEKMPIAGGNTTRATGGMNASETKYQEAMGAEDTNELFVEETIEGGKGINDPELVTYMAENSAEAIDWLDSMDINLTSVTFSGGFSVERIHRPEDGSAVGDYLVVGLLKQIEDRGIDIKYQTTVTDLVETDGTVTGVKATDKDGNELEYMGKAVVVATGGFGSNHEIVEKYKPELEGFVTTNHPGATGDAIAMFEKIGAGLVDIDQIQIHPTVVQETSDLVTEALRGEGAILVNQLGKRFTNELLTRDVVSAAEIEQEGGYAFILFDQALRDKNKAVESYINKGFVEEGQTYAELAEAIGVDGEALEATLTEYNEFTKAGVDSAFGRDTGLEPITAPPYYAIKIAPGIHHTMGGVKINTRTQVLQEDGTPIDGLYAAGEVTGGVHGGNRIGGNAVTDIVVFGKTAGERASAYAAENGGHGVREKSADTSEEAVINMEPGEFTDGTYTETADGNNGEITVEIVVENGNIVEINPIDHQETESMFMGIENNLIPEIIAEQSTDIDSVAGATVSSEAIKEAVEEAITN